LTGAITIVWGGSTTSPIISIRCAATATSFGAVVGLVADGRESRYGVATKARRGLTTHTATNRSGTVAVTGYGANLTGRRGVTHTETTITRCPFFNAGLGTVTVRYVNTIRIDVTESHTGPKVVHAGRLALVTEFTREQTAGIGVYGQKLTVGRNVTKACRVAGSKAGPTRIAVTRSAHEFLDVSGCNTEL
jgi:hypothetical protein